MKKKEFSIIIPTLGNMDLVQPLITSIRAVEKDNNYEIIMVYDGPECPILKKFCDNEDLIMLTKPKRSGYSASINMGFKFGSGDYFVVMNDDMLAIDTFLYKIKKRFTSDALMGVIGAKLLYKNNTIQHAGMAWIQGAHAFHHKFVGASSQYGPANISCCNVMVTGAFMAISRKAQEAIGLFPEQYYMTCEDADYCLRAWEAGYKVFYDAEICLYHLEGATRGTSHEEKLKKLPECYQEERIAIQDFYKRYTQERMIKLIDYIRRKFGSVL